MSLVVEVLLAAVFLVCLAMVSPWLVGAVAALVGIAAIDARSL